MRDILKAFFKTGVGLVFSMFFSVVSAKIVAVLLGPAGSGLYSLVRQMILTCVSLSTVGGDSALVQGIAVKEGAERDRYLSTVFMIYLAGGLILAGVIQIFAPFIAKTVFVSEDHQTITLVRLISIPVLLMTVNAYMNSVLNGFRAIGRLAVAQIVLSLVGAILAYPLAKQVEAGFAGAFAVMLAISYLGALAYSLWSAWRAGWLEPIYAYFMRFNTDASRHFFKIALATSFAGLFSTGVMMSIRVLVVNYSGLEGAGIFNVAWTISMTYVMLVLSSFSTYYLPKFSGTSEKGEKHRLMNNFLRVSVLLMIPITAAIIVFKPFLIKLMYTDKFMPTLNVMRWMLIGDFIKIISWFFGITMIAYADMRIYIIREFIAWGILLVLSVISLKYYGSIEGIGVAYVLLYTYDAVFVVLCAYYRYEYVPAKKVVLTWVGGFAFIVAASLLTWNNVAVDWILAIAVCFAACVFSLATLRNEELKKFMCIIREKGFTGFGK